MKQFLYVGQIIVELQEAAPSHGDVRDWQLVTKPLEHGRRTQSHSEKYCARCGWVAVVGIWGGLKWVSDHDGHSFGIKGESDGNKLLDSFRTS